MMKEMKKMTIGFLGGGQLASLLAQSALKREVNLCVYCQGLEEPAVSLVKQVFIGERDDEIKITEFFRHCDIVLLESEFFSFEFLQKMSDTTGTPVYPELNDYRKLYTKENQKKFFLQNGIPCTPFQIVSEYDLPMVEFPAILKLSHGGYDGYGNFQVNTNEEYLEALSKIRKKSDQTLLLEQKITIKKEFAALLVKGKNDSFIYPPCETIQREHVCRFVKRAPFLDENVEKQINLIMEVINQNLAGPGIYAFEFFETQAGDILVNEAAPRVHNSFHYSIEGYSASQFDMFLSAVLDEQLDRPETRYDYITMVNILGIGKGEYQLSFPDIGADWDFNIHMYGKRESRVGRKLGHVTLFGNRDNFQQGEFISQRYKL